MAARFKAQVCGRSLAGIVGSNPAGGMRVRRECLVFSLGPLQRADFSSREGLPSVHHCVWQGTTATHYTRNDQAGTGQTNSKFILHFHSHTLFTKCCLIKREGNWTLNRPNLIRITTEVLYKMSVPSLFSESPQHTLCALDRRCRKNAINYYYILVMFVRLFPYETPRLPLEEYS